MSWPNEKLLPFPPQKKMKIQHKLLNTKQTKHLNESCLCSYSNWFQKKLINWIKADWLAIYLADYTKRLHLHIIINMLRNNSFLLIPLKSNLVYFNPFDCRYIWTNYFLWTISTWKISMVVNEIGVTDNFSILSQHNTGKKTIFLT